MSQRQVHSRYNKGGEFVDKRGQEAWKIYNALDNYAKRKGL